MHYVMVKPDPVVYTDENGTRLVKAKDGEYYKAADVDATGNVLMVQQKLLL